MFTRDCRSSVPKWRAAALATTASSRAMASPARPESLSITARFVSMSSTAHSEPSASAAAAARPLRRGRRRDRRVALPEDLQAQRKEPVGKILRASGPRAVSRSIA